MILARFTCFVRCALLATVLLQSAFAAVPEATRRFNLPAGDAAVTLARFAEQADREIVFSPAAVRGVKTNAVVGEFAPREALDLLLARTPLVVTRDAVSGALAVRKGAADPNVPRAAPPTPNGAARLPNTSADPGETIALSPFEVISDKDVGYQAANTTSGSRLNTRLKDTPASISAFTPEFLNDIAATNLEEMLGYATNVEVDVEDATNGFNNPRGRNAEGNDHAFRMRGSPGGASQDYVSSSLPVDLYNVERAEVSSGPNSILFGLGQQGGLVSLTTKKANLSRNRTTLRSMLGTWKFERYEVDHNHVLAADKLALRLLGAYQNSQGWRHWSFTDVGRLSVAVAYRPLKSTTLHAYAEKGFMDNSITVAWNPIDQVSGWEDAGRPVFDGTVAQTGTNRLAAAANRFTWMQQDGKVYNLRGEFQSVNRYAGVETLLPPAVAPYNFSPTGPGGVRHQTFHVSNFRVEHRVSPSLNAELAYFRNHSDVEAHGLTGTTLRGDPNLSVPGITGTAAGSIPNAFARGYFIESSWSKDRIVSDNDVVRLAVAWEGGRGERWFGRHRLAGLLEHTRSDRLRRTAPEVFVDENNIPISVSSAPENAQNQVTRRNYVTPGDYTTYHGSNGSIPIAPFVYNNRTITATYASGAAGASTQTTIESGMVAAQSFWWQERVVTTLGLRQDRITFRDAQKARVTDPNDPRITSKRLVLGESDYDGTYLNYRYKPTTFTAGAVWHATNRLSGFFNLSMNNGQPRLDRTVLPDGKVPEPTEGRGRDFGLMLDVFGDERLFLRATWFQTQQLNDAAINNRALGQDQLGDMLSTLVAAGQMTPAEYDREAIDWNAAVIDVFTKGVEVEMVANPGKNLTLRASYSYSNRRREGFFPEIYAYFGERVPKWRPRLAGNPVELAVFERAVREFDDAMQSTLDTQSAPFGTRPHKASGTIRYRFSEGRLQGLFAGGSLRYQGRNFVSREVASGRDYWGHATLFGDAFAGYRFRIPRTGMSATLQLNVRNISNSYLATVGRYNNNYTGLRRVYLNEPRSYRLTTTLEF